MSALRITREPPLLEVVLDVPKANAISAATSREMGEVFTEFRDDPSLRIAILTGSGDRFFSAGWDLKAAAGGEAYESDFGVGGFGGFPELPGLDKPVIAAVNGQAVGGGFELVLAADLVVATEHAEMFLGEVFVGVIPDAGVIRLPRMVPPAIAKELILTGRRLTAGEAARLGLVNRVVAADRLMPAARELAHEIAAAAPLAVAATLQAMRMTAALGVAEAFEALRGGAVPAYDAMLSSDDAVEGPRAFAEGRAPHWRGR